ncbi:MAG: hypothetical protein MUC96_06110 [Myxococcaceae bacterium]|nr:hypothetical protein [Myxococcaceae bacterium]
MRLVASGLLLCLAACVECPRAPGVSAAVCARLDELRWPGSLPPSPGNRLASDEGAALLGFELFFDARLSRDGSVRCATCHVPERQFADGRATSVGLAPVTRNAPSLYASAWHRWQTWDGSADSAWAQPLLAFENEREMDFTRLELAHRVRASYRARYEALFGPLPPLDDAGRFPPRGRPGLPGWEALRPDDRQAVDRIAANVGKALEAYQRRLAFGPGRFERFVLGDAEALSLREREGLELFVTRGCVGCHGSGLFTDDRFHAIGWVDSPPRARKEALAALAASPFTAAGPFHDGPNEPLPPPGPADEGAYRTPSLRNVLRTGPWGHDGRFGAVEDAITSHGQPNAPSLARDEVAALVTFLGALEAAEPPLPWNGWPDR